MCITENKTNPVTRQAADMKTTIKKRQGLS